MHRQAPRHLVLEKEWNRLLCQGINGLAAAHWSHSHLENDHVINHDSEGGSFLFFGCFFFSDHIFFRPRKVCGYLCWADLRNDSFPVRRLQAVVPECSVLWDWKSCLFFSSAFPHTLLGKWMWLFGRRCPHSAFHFVVQTMAHSRADCVCTHTKKWSPNGCSNHCPT